eukprot:COSAG02_NODE_38443_length_429_cov_0.621212_1_plen_61_part_01
MDQMERGQTRMINNALSVAVTPFHTRALGQPGRYFILATTKSAQATGYECELWLVRNCFTF